MALFSDEYVLILYNYDIHGLLSHWYNTFHTNTTVVIDVFL